VGGALQEIIEYLPEVADDLFLTIEYLPEVADDLFSAIECLPEVADDLFSAIECLPEGWSGAAVRPCSSKLPS
jgi:hypothetical protein